ncbi:GNAT family N-acetyltransferase [Candidatus Nitrosotenuis cloacae]|uniref:GNAT family N-acetyltransferase n=1 Tax=Candidatus Nitrosotenuis cloacae TaxID=1603555 RepID=UPI0011DE38BC|nr:GNAT family protein [Candidatus Nitrosotenuis cloacae]
MSKLKSKKVVMYGKHVNFYTITKNDLRTLQRWRNSNDIFAYNTQYVLLNMINQENWYETLQKNSDRIMFMVTNKLDNPIGVCGLIHVDLNDKTASIAIIIGEKKFQSKGFGTAALQMLIDYGFNKLKLHRLEAEVFEYNETSIKLFKKMNFTQEIVLRNSLWRRGKWWNTFLFSILRNEHVKI